MRKILLSTAVIGLTIALVGCSSTTQENAENEAEGKKILEQMQSSPSWKFAEAESRRDAQAMFEIAQNVSKKNPEAAKKLYERCAFVAAMQQKKALFNEIAALNSEAKKYGFLIQKGNAPSMLPQLVKVNSVAEAAKVGEGMQPVWGAFVADCYENLTKENAEIIAANVNSARESFSAEDLLAAAKDLSAYKAKSEVPEQLKVQTIIREAVNLAEVANDAKTMQAIIDFCREKSILPASEQKDLAGILKGMGKTRGSYVNVRYGNGVSARQYRQNGWNVSNIRLSDGSVITIRDDGTTQEKLEMFKKALRKSPLLCRYLNKGVFKRNSTRMSNGEMAQIFMVFQALAEEMGTSFSQVVKMAIREAEKEALKEIDDFEI